MVKEIIIDCENLMQREQAHRYLAEKLAFPAYYGRNLDALYDCLAEIRGTTLILRDTKLLRQPDSYGMQVLKTIEEAAGQNPGLLIKKE